LPARDVPVFFNSDSFESKFSKKGYTWLVCGIDVGIQLMQLQMGKTIVEEQFESLTRVTLLAGVFRDDDANPCAMMLWVEIVQIDQSDSREIITCTDCQTQLPGFKNILMRVLKILPQNKLAVWNLCMAHVPQTFVVLD